MNVAIKHAVNRGKPRLAAHFTPPYVSRTTPALRAGAPPPGLGA